MILEKVNSPQDIKGLSYSELRELAEEIRQLLIARVSSNGGHLASNLGVVELTLALHRVFSSPRDKIIWDVSHQSYVHKILTGRKEGLPSLRQFGGISGFADPQESPHDVFAAGHASTSISAAVGMALARDLAREDYHVVAVIGDGGLSGGMAFEAINYAGHIKKRLILVLNDNGMSISPSVGAISRFLGRVRLDPRYQRAKGKARQAAYSLPLGATAWEFTRKVKEALKRALLPTVFWESLGFTYFGPINGHNLEEVEEALRQARDYAKGPILVHVLTKKGKGYEPAEEDAEGYHGLPPPTSKNAVPSYSQVMASTVRRLMREDPRIVAITAAMLSGTGLSLAQREFPERVFDVGICEQHAVTMAAGLASRGFIPIVAIYSTFLQRAYDQIIHDVCLQDLPVVFAIDRGGIVGDDGKTHQGAFDISYLGCIPNMVVSAPKDERELQDLLFTAVRSGRPMAIRYPRGNGVGVPFGDGIRELSIGKGEKLREGEDGAILALGSMVYPSLQAADLLTEEGVRVSVASARFVKPLDASLVLELAEGKRLLVVEENAVFGGLGSAVLRLLRERKVQGRQVGLLGLPDEFIPHGAQDFLRSLYGLDARGIANEFLALLRDGGKP